MTITYVHWQREELKVEHPDPLDPDEARTLVIALLKSGKVPPGSATGQRRWGAEVETTSGRYRVLIRQDSVTVEPVNNQEDAGGGA